MMLLFPKAVPVITPLGEGIILYVTDGGPFENDIFTIALKEDGHVRHFMTNQIQIQKNGTFDITND